MAIRISSSLRRAVGLMATGAAVFLAGCAVVPADSYVVGAPVVTSGAYYGAPNYYSAPYYGVPAPYYGAPVYVGPPVSIGIWGGFGGGRHHGGRHPGWRGDPPRGGGHHIGPRPGWGGGGGNRPSRPHGGGFRGR